MHEISTVVSNVNGERVHANAKVVLLADSRQLIIHRPVVDNDRLRMMEFLSGLPRQLRNYLRYDVANASLCHKRFDQVDEKDHWRYIADLDGNIVGEGMMDREPFGWTHHIAHVRTVVDPNYVHLGIGTILLNHLVETGSASGVERFYSEVIKEHTEMIRALEKEGFVYESTRTDYARDLNGRLHDVVIMSNDKSAVWRKLQENMEDLDIRMPQIYRGE